MKIGTNKLKTSDGSVRTFKSGKARDAYEHYVQAIKHGWKPSNRYPRKKSA